MICIRSQSIISVSTTEGVIIQLEIWSYHLQNLSSGYPPNGHKMLKEKDFFPTLC